MTSEIQALLVGAVSALAASSVFLLALLIGFCVVFGFSKLRRTGKTGLVHRSLDEMVGEDEHARYLPPDAPRGPVDQLRTPELLEAAGRKPA